MNQSLMQRVGRLVSGAAHQIVNAAEDLSPSNVMEQAIRELEETIDEMESARGQATARRHLAGRRLSEETERHAEIESQCRIGLEKGRRDLAGNAMSQMLDIESQLPVLQREIDAARAEELEIDNDIEALSGRRNEMREEFRRIEHAQRTSATSAPSGEGAGTATDLSARARTASEVFDRSAERNTGLPTTGDTPSGDDARKRAELKALKRTHRIDERLREMQGDG